MSHYDQVWADMPDSEARNVVMWFGSYKKSRVEELDDLKPGYRRYMTEMARRKSWAENLNLFASLNKKYNAWLKDQQDDQERLEPGARIMTFGKHRGSRIDQLTERYRRQLHRLSYEDDFPSAELLEFRDNHEEYLDWLDERRSPLSTEIWFGNMKGHEMRVLYNAPRKWRWLLKNCELWRDDLKDIERRYNIWMSWQAPRRQLGSAAQRTAPNIINPVGQRLDRRDDAVASDAGESYITDGGFVVRDSQYDGDDDYEDDEDYDYQSLLNDGTDEDDDLTSERTARDAARGQVDEAEAEALDSSPPPLGEIVNSSARKRASPTKRRLVSEDPDVSSAESCRAFARGSQQKRRQLIVIPSDSED